MAVLEAVGFQIVDPEVAFLEQVALCLGEGEPGQVALDLSFDQFAGVLDLAMVVVLDVVGLDIAVVAAVDLDIAAVFVLDLDNSAAVVVDLGSAVAEAVDLDIVAAVAVDLDNAAAVVVDLGNAVAVAAVGIAPAVAAVGTAPAVPGIDHALELGTVPDAAGTVAVVDSLVEFVDIEVHVLVDTVLDLAVG